MKKNSSKWPQVIYMSALFIWGGFNIIFLFYSIFILQKNENPLPVPYLIFILLPFLFLVTAYLLVDIYRKSINIKVPEKQYIQNSFLYQDLFENSPDPGFLISNLIIRDCNSAACQFLNQRKSNILGLYFYQVSPAFQSDGSASREKISKILQQIKPGQPRQFEWQFRENSPKNSDHQVTANYIKVRDEDYIQLVILSKQTVDQSDNIKDWKQDKFELIFNSVTDGISIISEELEVIEANDRILNRLNLSREAFNRLPARERYPQSIMKALPVQFQKLKDTEEISFELDNIEIQGRDTTLEVRVKKIVYENKPAYIAVSRDISDKKLTQHQVYNAVIKAEENERSRLAKELHDGISPLLSTSKLYAQSALDCTDDNLRVNILRRVESTIDDAIQSITEISNNLSPHILENFGLIAAIESFTDKIKELKNLEIKIESNIKERLEDNIEITLYRIVTELINNTIRHAQAKKVYIEITRTESINLNYRDDGIGFNFQEILRRKKGMGIYNMINRIKSLNGYINFMNSSTKGILISATIPVYAKQH